MKHDTRVLTGVLATALAAVAAALITALVIVADAKAPDKADCLYAAMVAYPDWQPGQARVTETVPECDGLPEADKQEVRTIVADYTAAAIRNLGKAERS